MDVNVTLYQSWYAFSVLQLTPKIYQKLISLRGELACYSVWVFCFLFEGCFVRKNWCHLQTRDFSMLWLTCYVSFGFDVQEMVAWKVRWMRRLLRVFQYYLNEVHLHYLFYEPLNSLCSFNCRSVMSFCDLDRKIKGSINMPSINRCASCEDR